jgi:hypothetical protein
MLLTFLRVLVVGPVAIAVGMLFAVGFGLAGGVAVGLCILAWPAAWAFDAIRRRLPRRGSMPH